MTIIQKKICLLGDFAVGKTSLVRRFVEGIFDDKYLSTIGVKVSRRPVRLQTETINLIVWDLAGGNEWLRSNQGYLRGLAGAVLVCDLTRSQTLSALALCAAQVRDVNPQAVLVLAANKIDLENERQVTEADIQAVSTTWQCPYWLTSAKTGAQVPEMFEALANRLLLA